MTLRASDIEATAIGAAAAAGAALKQHERECLECSRARKARTPDKCCDTGYEMVRVIKRCESQIQAVRAEKAARRRGQNVLF